MKTKEDAVFNGRNVFLAFRTNQFHGVDNEHMTLKFFGSQPKWGDIIREAAKWHAMLPVGIYQSGIAVWKAKDYYHEVSLQSFEGHPSLFGKNWHITLDSSVEPIAPRWWYDIPDEIEMHDELWVGYKDSTGNKKWITYNNAKHLVRTV